MTTDRSRLTPDAQITLSQVAQLAGVGPSAVSNWRRRFAGSFPVPVGTTPDGKDLYGLDEILAWLDTRGQEAAALNLKSAYFAAADLLRAEGSSERVSESICVAAGLLVVARERCQLAPDMAGLRSSPAYALELAESVTRRLPELTGVFEPLFDLRADLATSLVSLILPLDGRALRALFEQAMGQRGRFVESHTHESVGGLLVSLSNSTPETVFDPAVGEGGFLLAAGRRWPNARLVGQDINRTAWRLATLRLLLANRPAALEVGDSLREDKFPELRADFVVCDPPYNAQPMSPYDLWSDPRWTFGIPSAKNSDFAWLQHVIHHLTPSGYGCVLLPTSSLTRRGSEAEIRRELVRRGAVEAVITLAGGTALHTSIPLALWVVRQPSPGDKPRPVLLIDTAAVGSAKGGGIEGRASDRVAAIVGEWRRTGETRGDDDIRVRHVPIVELLANDSNLLPSRWMVAGHGRSSTYRRQNVSEYLERVEEVRARIANAASVTGAAIYRPGEGHWTSVRQLQMAEAAEVIKGSRVKPEDCRPEGPIRVLRTQDLRAGLAVRADMCFVDPDDLGPRPALTVAGDIVISPASGRLLAMVDEVGGHALASPLQALRVKGDTVNRTVLAAFLASPRNRRFVDGTATGYARLELGDLEVPVLSLDASARMAEALRAIDALAALGTRLAGSAEAAREALLEATGTREPAGSERPALADDERTTRIVDGSNGADWDEE